MRNLAICACVLICSLLGSLAIVAAASPAAQDPVPVGTIIAWAGEPEAVPADWKLCDGSAVLRSRYQALFAAIGTVWGAPNNKKFNLPDLRGRFIRGADEGSSRDPDAGNRSASKKNGNSAGVGSVQEDSLQNHTHELNEHSHRYLRLSDLGWMSSVNLQTGGFRNVIIFWQWGLFDSESTKVDIYGAKQCGTKASIKKGEETRSTNAAVNFIIKVR